MAPRISNPSTSGTEQYIAATHTYIEYSERRGFSQCNIIAYSETVYFSRYFKQYALEATCTYNLPT